MILKSIPFLFCQIVIASGISMDNELIFGILNEFDVDHPTILTVDWQNDSVSTILLMKSLFMKGQYCRMISHHQNIRTVNAQSQNVLAFTEEFEDIIEVFEEVKDNAETLVFITYHSIVEEVINSVKAAINHKVFVVDQSTLEAYETYSINDRHIVQNLGQFDHTTKDFIWSNGIERDFVTRRSNFQGMTLKVMTEPSGNDVILKHNWKEEAKFLENNQTYLVTNFVSGRLYDVFSTMQKELNFTAELFKRKDNGWGQVYPQQDGSFHASGMVGDVFFGRADVIVALLTVTVQRAQYIDFLNPITPDVLGLFIPSGNSEGKFEFMILFHPFRFELWMMVLLMTCVIALFKFCIMLIFSSSSFLGSIGLIWTTLMAYFGGIPLEISIDNRRTYKLTIFISLLSGLIVWIAYQSSLTSELAVIREKLPFEDLEGLARSSWKLALPSKTTTTTKPFLNSPSDSVYSRVLQNNIDKNSFTKDQNALEEKLITESNTAAYTATSDIFGTQSYANCKVKIVWKVKKGDISFGLLKNSPFKLFLNNVLSKMFERGQIKRIFEKWEVKEPSCEPLLVSGDALSLQKLISVFLIIAIGIFIALSVLVHEKFNAKKLNTDEQDMDYLRFEMLMSELNRHLDMKMRPNVGLLTILQDASEKIKKD